MPPLADTQPTAAAPSPACLPVNPYVFLVGAPRSGTTMLKRMAGAHPQLAISRETHWIPKTYERRRGMTDDGRVTSKIIDKLFEHHRFPQMKVSRDELLTVVAEQPGLTYANLVSYLFDKYGQRKGKPYVGDKTPKYVRKLPTLWELWPRAKVVHIVRDGRNVWLSMRNWRYLHKAAGQFATYPSAPVATTALWWKAHVAIGVEDAAINPHQYLQLIYESLVEQPEKHCQEIAAFLQLPYHTAMTRYYEGKTQLVDGVSTNGAWLPPTPGLRDWRTSMTPVEVDEFEWVAGDLLEQLGYPVVGSPPSATERDNLARVKQAFTDEVVERGWRLPRCW